MVREKREALSDQALQLLLVSLQTEHDEACERLLRYALERLARAAPHRLVKSTDHEPPGSLAHLRVSYLDLSGLQLPGLDIAFSHLHKPDFRRSDLRGSRALKAELQKRARFDDANLEGAAWAKVQAAGASFRRVRLSGGYLYRAQLSDANFYRADLRRTNFRFAALTGARFESAQLAKADFFGAEFDDRALNSILAAKGWREAVFGVEVLSRLEELAPTSA